MTDKVDHQLTSKTQQPANIKKYVKTARDPTDQGTTIIENYSLTYIHKLTETEELRKQIESLKNKKLSEEVPKVSRKLLAKYSDSENNSNWEFRKALKKGGVALLNAAKSIPTGISQFKELVNDSEYLVDKVTEIFEY